VVIAQVCEAGTPDRLCGNSTITATVAISDVNEAPAFLPASLSLSVSEHAAVGAVVGALAWTDPDLGDTATASLVTPRPSVASGPFAFLSDGRVVLQFGLDAEARSVYTFQARVTDAGGLFGDGSVMVTVLDVPDAPVMQCGVEGAGRVGLTLAERVGGVGAPLPVVVTDGDAGSVVGLSLVASSGPGVGALFGALLLPQPSLDLPSHVQRCV
jgi:hypothetical protein